MDDRLVDFEANFSVLDRYGVDVTAEKFITNPAIGRDNQLKELMLILLTPEKSAILIGKPGIGKTAIVEGLAYRMQRGEVPEALKGYTIINIKTASLLGTMPSGESKVQKMIDELKTREKIILFVDEIHMLIGATDSSSLDFANIFKEGLGRGSIKVIGATTTEEYERYILRDKAFTRRFQKVDVPEPTHDETVQIMMGTLPKFEKQTGRKMKYTPFIQERIMNFLVEITSEYKRVFALGSRYPDVCLTLLKQAFSYTVFDNREYMDIFDVRKSIENSKNIYPDVIKKELPRFDKEFNDIILEEKGEKPIEEWRREVGPIRYEQSVTTKTDSESTPGIIPNIFMNNDNEREINKNSTFDDLKKLEDNPSMVDKKRIQEYQPVKSILSEKTLNKFAKIGPTAISKGLKEKFNQKSDSKNIDDLLLSSDIKIINKSNDDIPNIPFKYTVTDELKPGGTNELLLGGQISSTLDEKKEKILEIETYKSDNLVERQLTSNYDTLLLDEKSIDNKKDISSLHSNDKFFDKLDVAQNFNDNRNNDNNSNNKIETNSNIDDLLFKGRLNIENNSIKKDNRESLGYDGSSMNKNINSSDNIDNRSFYEEKTEINDIDSSKIISAEKVESNNENNSDFFVNTSGGSGFFNNSSGRGTRRETLFGAPMYDTEEDNEKDDSKTDIFGQLLVPDNNMIIRDGKIVDNLSGLKVNDNDNADNNNNNFIKQDDIITDNSYDSVDNNAQYNTVSTPKKWKFLPQYEDNNKNETKFNELKLDNINSLSGNNDIEKEGTFINFNDLNSGKISSNEVNKFISLSKEEPKEQVSDILHVDNKVNIDLNLEENFNEENYFDDFFDD